MTLHPLVEIEWREARMLSMRSLLWIEEHADVGDPHPIVTAITQLRATDGPGREAFRVTPP